MTAPYAQPTMELRFVQRNVTYNGFTKRYESNRVLQQKWIVQDGDPFEAELGFCHDFSTTMVGYSRMEHLDQPPVPFRPLKTYCWYVRTKPEWRDIPLVTDSTDSTT